MEGRRHGVRHEGGEQRVHSAEDGQRERGGHQSGEERRVGRRECERRQPLGNGSKRWHREAQDRRGGACSDQRQQGPRDVAREPRRELVQHEEGEDADGERAEVGACEGKRQDLQRVDDLAAAGVPEHHGHLQRADDAPDPGHEARQDCPGDQSNGASQLQYAHGDLHQARHGHDGEDDGGVGVLGDDQRHDDGHRPRWARDLRRRAAEERCEETREDRPV
mmetsp:Transcript_12739/g.39352  ORF Transcript_12739/g.39352 Transcript_12739/m.39352 type:complete len:221 (-) Transcript_12739:587-1249(-)